MNPPSLDRENNMNEREQEREAAERAWAAEDEAVRPRKASYVAGWLACARYRDRPWRGGAQVIPRVGATYRVQHEVECQDVHDGEAFALAPVRVETETWEIARVIARDGDDLIVQHPTGIRGTLPRIDRMCPAWVKACRWTEIVVPEEVES